MFITATVVVQVGLASPVVAAGPTPVAQATPKQPPVTPGQATPGAPATGPGERDTERARGELANLIRERQKARAHKASLARQYDSQLAEIDRLKRSRASWRRDRLIRDRMGKSHGTAKKLASVASRLRRLESREREARRELAAAIDRELAAVPSSARRAALLGWRRDAVRGLRRDAKTIVLPDQRIDPLADPEELEYQVSLIRQSEKQLTRELARLGVQARRYRRMVAMRQTRQRAAALGSMDDDRPRRSSAGRRDTADRDGNAAGGAGTPTPDSSETPTGSTDGAGGLGHDSGSDGQEGGSDGQNSGLDGAGGDPMFDVVLANVIDAPTIDALRAAETSGDPAVKARAAERAREQVERRLERLKKRRNEIQKRANRLRRR
ncbi:MAG: hypothetical protein MJE77_48100 [Proteobacteria bacterium]|nr:hypothetical protein [Pseudomonadota bacterium]